MCGVRKLPNHTESIIVWIMFKSDRRCLVIFHYYVEDETLRVIPLKPPLRKELGRIVGTIVFTIFFFFFILCVCFLLSGRVVKLEIVIYLSAGASHTSLRATRATKTSAPLRFKSTSQPPHLLRGMLNRGTHNKRKTPRVIDRVKGESVRW